METLRLKMLYSFLPEHAEELECQALALLKHLSCMQMGRVNKEQ